ncbi:MAG: peptide deformylase [Cellvibrionales bacterium]|nr:peptide deformylase [Cellvibrionales bacterium]
MIKSHNALLSLTFCILLLIIHSSALTNTSQLPCTSKTLDQLQEAVDKLLRQTSASTKETLALIHQSTRLTSETQLNTHQHPDDYSQDFIDKFEQLSQKIWTNDDLYQRIESIPLASLTSADKHTINHAKTLFSRYGFQPETGDIHLTPIAEGKLLNILQYPEPELHQKAHKVTEFNDELQELIDNMLTTMYQTKGVGLAATQIGVRRQVVVMDVSITQNHPMVFINPIVTPIGDTLLTFPQGCLSVKDTMDVVTRPKKVRIEALDRYGNPFVIEDDKLIAVCIQHELDHLNGILFIQHLPIQKQKSIATRLGHLELARELRPSIKS